MIRNTAATTTFTVAPARRPFDAVEVQGTAAAAEAAAAILLTGQGVEVCEITPARGYSYYNPRVRRIHQDAARLAMSRAEGTPAEDGVNAAGRVGVNGVTVGWTFPIFGKSFEYGIVATDGAVLSAYPSTNDAVAALSLRAAEVAEVAPEAATTATAVRRTPAQREAGRRLAAEAEAATLPEIPAAATEIVTDAFNLTSGRPRATVYDRTNAAPGEWGDDLGRVAFRADSDLEDLTPALTAAGWTQGDALTDDDGCVVTTWTR